MIANLPIESWLLIGASFGFLVAVAWVLFAKGAFYDLYEMIPGFLAGLLATVVVSLAIARAPAGVPVSNPSTE